MRGIRHRSKLAAVAVVALLAAACGGDEAAEEVAQEPEAPTEADAAEDPAEAPQEEDGPEEADQTDVVASGDLECGEFTIGFSQPLPNPAIDLIRDIIDNHAGERGNSLTSAVANMDPNKQISDVDTMLQQGIDVLVAYPVDTNAIQPALQRATDEGVPIVAVDTSGEGPWVSSVLTGNYEAAKLGGDWLAEQLGAGGAIGVVEGPTIAQTLVDRNNGFADAAEEGGLEVLSAQTGDPSGPDAAREITDGWGLQHGEAMEGIIAFNDLNALGVASALGEGFEPLVVGVNGEPQAVEAVQAGRLDATADVQPVAVALSIYYAAEHAFCGEDVPAEIHVPPVMITPDNAGDWRSWEEQQDGTFSVELDVDGDTATVITDGLTFGP